MKWDRKQGRHPGWREQEGTGLNGKLSKKWGRLFLNEQDLVGIAFPWVNFPDSTLWRQLFT